MKNLFSFITQSTAFILVLTLSSCGSPIDSVSDDDCDKLQDVAAAFIDAALLHGQDPSPENCRAYREAGVEYIDHVKDCSLAFSPGLEDTEEQIAALGC